MSVNLDELEDYRAGARSFPIQDEEGELITQKQRLKKIQVENPLGGYSFKLDDISRLTQFLILGCERGTYTAGEPAVGRENSSCIDRLIMKGKGLEVVAVIKDVSTKGRACKQKPLIYALARCSISNDPDTKNASYKILSDVCRIPTHLFQFIAYCENESAGSGWGRGHRKAVSDWYHSFYGQRMKLAYLVTKFRSRYGWKHKDIIRLAHVKPKNNEVGLVLRYITKGLDEAKKMYCSTIGQVQPDPGLKEIAEFLEAVEKVKSCQDTKTMARLIDRYNLVREHVPTEMLISADIWQALLGRMPMEALIRCLGRMTAVGLLKNNTEYERLVMEYLRNRERIQQSRIHPFRLLDAYFQYKKGRGDRGKLTWIPNKNIVEAMDDAFLLCFSNVKPTGKRFLIAVDVCGSMDTPCVGNPSITARDASSAMMMMLARIEKEYEVVAFANDLAPLDIKNNETISTVLRKVSNLYYSLPDCARPITYAIENKKLYDVFIIFTSTQTYYGNIHPCDALVRYRSITGIRDAKLIVAGMACNSFTIADPEDPFMLDIVGFDAATPCAMDEFIRGKIM